MIKVNKTINLGQLDKELNGQGLICSYNDEGLISAVGLAEGNSATTEELDNAIKNHLAKELTSPTVQEKLALVGLNLNDLKEALGLQA